MPLTLVKICLLEKTYCPSIRRKVSMPLVATWRIWVMRGASESSLLSSELPYVDIFTDKAGGGGDEGA